MAQEEKNGIRYFNIDCNQEDKLEFITAKHKIEGYGIVVQLWRKIYSIEGYYCPWSEKNIYLFAKDNGVEVETLNAVVSSCFEEHIFSKTMFEKHGILTSSGVQKRWLKIVKDAKRKCQEIEPKYDLLVKTPEEVKKTPEEHVKTPVIDIQSKVKESKVNKSRIYNTRDEEIPDEIDIKKLGENVLKYFGFNEVSNFDKLRLVTFFLNKKLEEKSLSYFNNQFENYKKYKELSKELKHNFTRFLGKQKDQFEGGKWDEANWEQKIEDFNNTKNGKESIRNAAGNRYTATTGKEFGSLR